METFIKEAEQSHIIVEKEIGFVPYSSEVDFTTFSRVLDDNKVVASYKMYWLLAIIDEVALGNMEIDFKKLVSRMVAYAWYPISMYKLNFGLCDNLAKVVDYIADTYNFASNCDKQYLITFIYESEDKILNKMLKELTLHVPYRFLSPFFKDQVKGEKKVMKTIEDLSKNDKRCIYEIYKDEKLGNCIRIKDGWDNYLKYNYRILKGWAYYKLVCFLQKRNVNVPGIALKLEPQLSRGISTQTDIWKKVIERKRIIDLYTGKPFIQENYDLYGGLSLDHFIPWSFVLHNQIWNLVPTFKNINSKKSDNLMPFDKYFDSFSQLQYDAFCFVVDDKRNNEIEEYRGILKVTDCNRFRDEGSLEEFAKRIRKEIEPVYNIAVNQGFSVVENIDY